MRLIDANAIKIKPVYMHDICGVVMIRVEDIARILNDMPTISPAPERKTGKWIYITDGHYEYFKCDQCEKHSGEPTPFCRYCGADMMEGQDG